MAPLCPGSHPGAIRGGAVGVRGVPARWSPRVHLPANRWKVNRVGDVTRLMTLATGISMDPVAPDDADRSAHNCGSAMEES